MSKLYTDNYIEISLDKNKLMYTIYSTEQLPDMDSVLKIQENLNIFFSTISKTNKKFYQIFIFNNIRISSLLEFTDRVEVMVKFFRSHYNLFFKQLLCSIIVLDNSVIKNTMDLTFKIIPPTKPVHFIKNKDEIEIYLDKYK